MSEEIEKIDKRIEELREQRKKLKAFLRRLHSEKCQELLRPWMARIRGREQGVQVSYLIKIDEDGDIVHYSVQQTGNYQGNRGDWDLYLSIKADPFMPYYRLRDAAFERVRSELHYIEQGIENKQEYRDALAGEVSV